jgi:hypothetical protein
MLTTTVIAQLAAEFHASEKMRVQVEHFSRRFPEMTVRWCSAARSPDRSRGRRGTPSMRTTIWASDLVGADGAHARASRRDRAGSALPTERWQGRYPWHGRGAGFPLGPHARYVHEANAQTCVLGQIETLQGIGNLLAIAQTEGVDGVFIGSADLSASLGHVGNPAHPDVQATIEDAIRRYRLGRQGSGHPDDRRGAGTPLSGTRCDLRGRRQEPPSSSTEREESNGFW